jgi:sRNA-binding protein
MTDPHPVVAEPTPAPATVLPALIAAYPACFDWEQPRPLKVGIHQDLAAAGFEKAAINVNHHGKITRDPGKSTLNIFHPGVV